MVVGCGYAELGGKGKGEAVVARMDNGMTTRLGEQRARLRQRTAETNQLEDG